MPYIGEIRVFGGNFAPVDWALCNGQLLPIADYTALYNLIGTIYGGDGVNTFALPNLQSRVPIGTGTYAGNTYMVGQTGGTETTTLTTVNMPAHTHTVTVTGTTTAGTLTSSEDGHRTTPGGNYPAVNGKNMYSTTTDGSKMAAVNTGNLTVSVAGQSLPVSNIQPYLAINYIICLNGIYPS